jgi:hypothetical protein
MNGEQTHVKREQQAHCTQGGQTERRQQGRRFAVAASANFAWQGRDGLRHDGRGRTRDISIHGVFIWAHDVPKPGDAIEVTVTMPPMVADGMSLRLHGRGCALRVDRADSHTKGFAAKLNFRSNSIGAPTSSGSETQRS